MLSSYQEAFPDVYKLLVIALTIPVSTLSADRSFSKLRLIKTYLTSRMASMRLSNFCPWKTSGQKILTLTTLLMNSQPTQIGVLNCCRV